jgi:NADPH-dependent glutamate synthase beta subunit-like oxidoreductase
MASSTSKSRDASVSKGVAVIGNSVTALQAALTLAQMDVEVKLITGLTSLGWDNVASATSDDSILDQRYLWPLLVRAASHPLITMYTSAEVANIEGGKGDFKLQIVQSPRYIHEDLCAACGRCQVECSSKVTFLSGDQKVTHKAIHAPLLGAKAVPSAFVIEKNGFAPCRVACPLGINIQGFISLLSKDKIDKALALISEAAPFSGILGRVCRHPCEDSCNLTEVDEPVSIRALHRYAADNATGSIKYSHKLPAGSQAKRIAIVGSGPAGLTAAWELTRRGYSPTVFEAHGVIGGMLATGIPRFRLPREVREREIEAIRSLGIDIRTGITVGRDITISYLRERGYKTFFLAIGAQQNNRPNIPGEELEGVVDCMSLLLTLNLMVDTFVGANIVIIGDGNSAIDSARAAIRKNKGTVKVLSWTRPEEITAGEEELNEALQEGITIDYCTAPVEILGDSGKVTGVHCRRTRLTEAIMSNGRHLPEPIPNTDFLVDADHVVVAIGQSPNASQLNMEGLAVDDNTGVIKVNPLTLETSVQGVFSGGDCITGPNNVVEAMAAGLRAAESIDRYLQGHDLESERTLEPPQTASVDIETAEIAPYKRATMPIIRYRKRLDSYEETTTGLSAETAQRETQRCLDCSLCSQCMECTRVCELGAVFHDDSTQHFEVGAEVILRFPDNDFGNENSAGDGSDELAIKGIVDVHTDRNGKSSDHLAKAMATALETAIAIRPGQVRGNTICDDAELEVSHRAMEQSEDKQRVGVFLCRCSGSISSTIDFRAVSRRLRYSLSIICTEEVNQACTEEGAKQIADRVTAWQLDRLVLAACRCCNSEQVCYSCTDRRIMCQNHLYQHLLLPHHTIVECCNIREQCAWAHRDDPRGATNKAIQIITSGVSRVRTASPLAYEEQTVIPRVLILGGGLVGTEAARVLASRGYQAELVTKDRPYQEQNEKNMTVMAWPDSLDLNGSPGNYQAVLAYGSQSYVISIGAVMIDIEELNKKDPLILNTASDNNLLGRIISRSQNSGSLVAIGSDLLREITIGNTAGIYLLSPDSAESQQEKVLLGLATAARVSSYLEKVNIGARANAVSIDSAMCRGCGECAEFCPYIEVRKRHDGTLYACIDRFLCLGCGACIARCPAGAIAQSQQGDKQIVSTLRSMLQAGHAL